MQQAPGNRRPVRLTIRCKADIANQVQRLDRTRAGHVEQAIEFEPLFVSLCRLDELVQRVIFDFAAGTHRTDDHVAATIAAGVDQPAQNRPVTNSCRPAETMQDNVVELQSLGFVHGHDLQTTVRIELARYPLPIQHAIEIANIGQRTGRLDFLDDIQEAIDVIELFSTLQNGWPAQRIPGKLDAITQAVSRAALRKDGDPCTECCYAFDRISRQGSNEIIVVKQLDDGAARVIPDESVKVLPGQPDPRAA